MTFLLQPGMKGLIRNNINSTHKRKAYLHRVMMQGSIFDKGLSKILYHLLLKSSKFPIINCITFAYCPPWFLSKSNITMKLFSVKAVIFWFNRQTMELEAVLWLSSFWTTELEAVLLLSNSGTIELDPVLLLWSSRTMELDAVLLLSRSPM